MCRWCERDDSGEDGRAEMLAEGGEQVLDWVSFSIEAGHELSDIAKVLQAVAASVELEAGGRRLN